MDIGDWATAYAAIVATVVGGAQIWQYSRSGAHLRIRVTPNVMIVNGDPLDQDLISVTVTNVGTAPTTIEGLYVIPKKGRFPKKPFEDNNAYYIPNPQPTGSAPIIPKEVRPGEKWVGFIRLSEDGPNFRNGNYLACIGSTMHKKDLEVPIPREQS